LYKIFRLFKGFGEPWRSLRDSNPRFRREKARSGQCTSIPSIEPY
jgi:hypothetical protein